MEYIYGVAQDVYAWALEAVQASKLRAVDAADREISVLREIQRKLACAAVPKAAAAAAGND